MSNFKTRMKDSGLNTRVGKFLKGADKKKLIRDDGLGDKFVATQDEMYEAAEALIGILKSIAQEKKLPRSVADHFSTLDYTTPEKVKHGDDIYYSVGIYFGGNLSRFSLKIASGDRKGERTGDGIKNIVSLFDTGYKADTSVYGIWEGHSNGDVIMSKSERVGLHFMQEAADRFNSLYSQKYGASAFVGEDTDYYRDD